MSKIYRVMFRETASVQPGGSHWINEVLYCGSDRQSAREAYHQSVPYDYGGAPGSRCRQTVVDVIDDAETNSFDDDPVSRMEI